MRTSVSVDHMKSDGNLKMHYRCCILLGRPRRGSLLVSVGAKSLKMAATLEDFKQKFTAGAVCLIQPFDFSSADPTQFSLFI